MLAFVPLLLATAATAFVLPGGLHDGVYRAYLDERGTEIHERVSKPGIISERAPVTEAPDVSKELFKRDEAVWCGCGFTLNHVSHFSIFHPSQCP